ncbi:ABC transporter permease [bacterium]|nr:ABC transporter permease [bacterium]
MKLIKDLRKNPIAFGGLLIILAVSFVAIFAPVFAPFDPNKQELANRLSLPFTNSNLLGTDDFGRDILSRLIFGARISLSVGFISVGISLIFGIPLGLFAGFYGGKIDNILMRFTDILLSFPSILLAIMIVSVLKPGLTNAMIAIGIVGIPQYTRLVRSSVLVEKGNEYTEASKSLGFSDFHTMFVEILPNCLAPIIVQSTLGFASAILESAGLGFLGLGAQPPNAEWGLMLAQARPLILSAWWTITFPGIAILVVVLGFNLLGDGLRDILDPKVRKN